jgi:hypothetical protein
MKFEAQYEKKARFEREREKKIHQSEKGQREGEIKRELLQVVSQPNPIGFLP